MPQLKLPEGIYEMYIYDFFSFVQLSEPQNSSYTVMFTESSMDKFNICILDNITTYKIFKYAL